MMEDDQQFCLRWNNHQATLISVFDKLLEKGMHVDCTLAAEGQTLNAHKVVLSACSPYFESVLAQQYDKHPIIILKDVKYAELRAMMDYMYRGEVNISQDQLAALLKAAESLQIKGLSDNKPAQPNTTPIKQSCDSISGDTEDECRSNTSSPSSAAAPRKRRKRSTSTENNNIIPSVLDTNSSSNPPSTIQNNQPIHNGRTHVTDLTNEDDPPSTSALHSDVVQNFQWHMEQSRDDQSDGQRDSQVKSVEKLETEEPVKKTRSKATVDEALPNIDKSVAVIAEDRRVTRNSNVRRSKRLAEETQQQQVTTYAVLTNAIIKKEAPPPAAVPIPQTPAPSTDSPPTNPVTPLQEKKQPEELKDEESKEKLIRFYLEPKKNRLPCSQFLTTKGYKCPNCPKLYNARKNLVRHISLECGREPQFKCPECSSRKHRRNELKRHIQKKHPEAFIKHESDEKSD